MASSLELRNYLNHWFQLGKYLIINGIPHIVTPPLNTDRPSPEFEILWQKALTQPHLTYLEGNTIPLSELLTGNWEIIDCARCDMPIPLKTAGINDTTCNCHDMETWPNHETLQPHTPINSNDCLVQIRHRLTSAIPS